MSRNFDAVLKPAVPPKTVPGAPAEIYPGEVTLEGSALVHVCPEIAWRNRKSVRLHVGTLRDMHDANSQFFTSSALREFADLCTELADALDSINNQE